MTFADFLKSPAFLLAVIFVLSMLYTLYAKIKSGKSSKEAPAPTKQVQAAANTPATTANVSSGELELVDTDEKSAAVIMALVSYKSNIPLNRLSFKSIRLMEDK